MNERIPLATKSLDRIFGYDIARTFALIGMVIISFWELAGEEANSPGWLNFFVEIIMGRAAVGFVMLAGVGLHLLTVDSCGSGDPKRILESRHHLMKRALFLFIIGILNSLIWPWDILHFYAIYFMITAYLLCASNRLVWILVLLAIFFFADFMLLTQFDRGMEWDSIGPQDLMHLSGVFYHLMFGG
ncbi:MAG: heparan-alpha-glucosaminide N-acetyltransferase domain-containing protein, partial [Desulfobacterales bacterium]|nr:heparan-alpha-glucosaminide N-acetyltransferase domain-containing protein [Desulfobacterales bacterium]